MRGSMRRRGPSWELRVYLGHHPVTGAKRYATRSVRGPRADAERILRQMAAAAEAGATHRAGATFGELCETWLTHAQVQLAANTVAETRGHLDLHLLPALGDVALAALRPEHLDHLYRDLLDHGSDDGKPLSGSTVRRIHGVAHRALGVGVRWGWLATNPATGTMPPRPIRRPITPPSPQDVAALIGVARDADPALATLLLLAATTGARRGELCALRWSDLNPATGELDVVRAVTIANGEAIVGPTKTRRGRRIHLDRATLDALAAHRRRVDIDARRDGRTTAADGYVFSSDPTGRRPWRPDRARRRADGTNHRNTNEIARQHLTGLSAHRRSDSRHLTAVSRPERLEDRGLTVGEGWPGIMGAWLWRRGPV